MSYIKMNIFLIRIGVLSSIVMPFTEVLPGGLKVMTKRWMYALMVATIIVVGAIAGPVMAATQGTTAVPAPADNQGTTSGTAPETGINGIISAGYIFTSTITPPNFEWMVWTSPSDATSTLVYTVPSGYKLKIDDVTISYFGSTGYTAALMNRGVGGNAYFSDIVLTPYSHFEHSYQNLVLNGGESLKVKSTYGNNGCYWTITAHWV